MKNEYQVLNHPGCVDRSDLENTVDREDLVNMLGFRTSANGVNGQAKRTTGGPAKGDHLVQRERCFFPFSGHAWLEEAHSGLPAITEVSKG